MHLTDLLGKLTDGLGQSLAGFAPEIALVATIVLLLFVRLFQRSLQSSLSGLALVGTVVALFLGGVQLMNSLIDTSALAPPFDLISAMVRTAPNAGLSEDPVDLFAGSVVPGTQAEPANERLTGREPLPGGMLRFDRFTVFFRLFLLSFAAMTIWLTRLTGIPDREDSADFYTLLLGATLGMSLMTSANHLLMVYIAVEMASLPSYALAGFLKGRREASEASLKYVVFGAGASGIMLYGISLLAGRYGTAHIPTLAHAIAGAGGSDGGVLLVGLLLVLVGIAFKIAAVPFHFWCPDVFEGAAAEVAGFLSVASKAAALGLLARFVVSIASPNTDKYLGAAVAFLAAVTATYGNLAAYAQTNLKRLLAFSTIAHAGYMMMPIAAALVPEQPSALRQGAIHSLVFYLVIYFFMNLGAFAIVALIRNEIRSEDLKDYGGLVRRCPFLTVAMAVFLLSLTGIPPLAGFAAKFRIFAVLYETKLYWLLIVGLANTVFSLFYYVKVLRVMILDEPLPAATSWTVPFGAGVFCMLLVAFNVGMMLVWNGVDEFTLQAVPDLLYKI